MMVKHIDFYCIKSKMCGYKNNNFRFFLSEEDRKYKDAMEKEIRDRAKFKYFLTTVNFSIDAVRRLLSFLFPTKIITYRSISQFKTEIIIEMWYSGPFEEDMAEWHTKTKEWYTKIIPQLCDCFIFRSDTKKKVEQILEKIIRPRGSYRKFSLSEHVSFSEYFPSTMEYVIVFRHEGPLEDRHLNNYSKQLHEELRSNTKVSEPEIKTTLKKLGESSMFMRQIEEVLERGNELLVLAQLRPTD